MKTFNHFKCPFYRTALDGLQQYAGITNVPFAVAYSAALHKPALVCVNTVLSHFDGTEITLLVSSGAC